MKLALVALSCDDETGIGRIVKALAGEFVKGNHQVTVVSQRISGVGEKVRSVLLPGNGFPTALNRVLFSALSPPVINRLEVDVVNAFGVGRKATVVTAQSCHRAAVQILGEYRQRLIWRRNLGFFDRLSLREEEFLLTSPETRIIIAVSQLVKQQITSHYPVDASRILVIPNGVDYELLMTSGMSATNRARLRQELEIQPEDFALLFIGNEFDRKGLEPLIDSLTMLKDQRLKLIVIGNDDPSKYRQLASTKGVLKQIRFLGGVSGPEVFFSAADAFVLPTLYEPFGIVIIEAMAAGISVITARGAGAVEGMEDRVHGRYLEDPASVEELSEAIRELRLNESLRMEIKESAQSEAKRFDWANVAAQTLTAYEKAHPG